MALLSPQQRIRLAHYLRQRANSEKLPVRKKQDLRRKAANLVKANLIEVSQQRQRSEAEIKNSTIIGRAS